jgi:type IV fimbrial biogenesis protein FimT
MQMLMNWQSCRQQPNKHPGFTGVEVLAAIVSGVLLFLLGMPLYSYLTYDGETNLLRDESLASQLEYARLEAMRRDVPVTVCPSRDGRNCQRDGDWSAGWVIFIDNVRPMLHVSVGDKLLYRQKRIDGSHPLVAAMDVIQYQPDGSIRLD